MILRLVVRVLVIVCMCAVLLAVHAPAKPPHNNPPVSAVPQDYPDSLSAAADATRVWVEDQERQERERTEAAEARALDFRRSVPRTTTSPAGDDAAACTRAHESDTAGGYTTNTGNGYYGAYQFLQSTWDATVTAMGRLALVGVRPSDASPADQDAAFWFLWADGAGASHFGGRCL